MLKGKGFTLVEILLVIVIIGILGAIVIPRITYTESTAKKNACYANVAALNSQIELYRMQEGSYPAVLSDLENASTNNNNQSYIDAVPTCPVNSSNYTYNGTTGRVTKHTTHP